MLAKLLPSIPTDQRKRFKHTLDETATTSLLFGALVLSTAFLAEAISQLDVGRVLLCYYPAALSALLAALFAGLQWGWRPRYVGFLTLVVALTPFTVSLLNETKTDVTPFYVLELVGVCVFVPYVRLCLTGAVTIGVALVASLWLDGSNNLSEILCFSIPAWGLGLFAFVGRQSGLRRTFLKEVDADQANRELRLSKLALEHTSHYIVWFDKAGRVRFANESVCEALGLTKQEFLDRQVHQLLPELPEPAWQALAAELENTGSDRQQLRFRCHNGEDIDVEMQFDLVGSGMDQIICGVAVDLTKRKQMEVELERVQKLEGLGTLTGGIAHDYNNLLVPIVTNATMLLRDLESTSDMRQPLEDIAIAGERAAALTEQLLVYTGVGNAKSEPICIATELDAIASLLRSSLRKGTTLTIHNERKTPRVLGESAQLHQVLSNLVINAAQSIDKNNGEIHIRLGLCELDAEEAARLAPASERSASQFVTCEVSDNGCGISAEGQARMFDPFYTNKVEGRGLGLSAALGIMKNHGGGIEVQSATGIGTNIKIYLPVDESNHRSFSVPRPHIDIRGNARVILFADDEPLVRKVGEKVLQEKGFQVLLAECGNTAIELFEKQSDRIEAVILDNRMPGPGIAATIDSLHRCKPGVRIIASSGFAADIPEGLRDQCVSFLQKPYTAQRLVETLCDVVQKQPRASFAPHASKKSPQPNIKSDEPPAGNV